MILSMPTVCWAVCDEPKCVSTGDRPLAIDFLLMSSTDTILSGTHHLLPVVDSRTLPGDTMDYPVVSTHLEECGDHVNEQSARSLQS